MRVVIAGIVYGLICMAIGGVLGPLRVLFVEPQVGLTIARLFEAPFLLLAMFFASRFAIHLFNLELHPYAPFAIGLLAFCIVAGGDFFIGRIARGISIEEQIRAFSKAPGLVYGILLLALIVMPILSIATEIQKSKPRT